MKSKNVYFFNKVIYKGNLDRDFFLFCCKYHRNLYWYILIHFCYSFLALFSNKMELLKFKKYHKYILKVVDINDIVIKFYKEYSYKLDPWFLDKITKKSTVVSSSPYILVEKFIGEAKLIAYRFDEKGELDILAYGKELEKVTRVSYQEVYMPNKEDLLKYNSKIKFIVKGSKFCQYKETKIDKFFSLIKIPLLMLILCFMLLLISFTFTTVYLDVNFIKSYLSSPLLLLLNLIPILIVLILGLIIFKRLWLSFGFTSILVFILGIVNKTKLYYRDDVLKFEDVTLLKEAFIMTSRYDIIIRWYTVVCIVACLITMFILKKFIKKFELKWKYSLLGVLLVLGLSFGLCKCVYSNEEIYYSVGDETLINKWLATRMSQIRGLVYPFIYSIREIQNDVPDHYDVKAVKNILEKYDYDDIEEKKKVNIIGIMFEAYNDFSKFENIEFTTDIYKDFHDVQSKSLSGNIVVNVFGGGTIVTERNFLTGYYNFPSFRRETYSYVTYFKEQGYYTEAMHPAYGAFYNRSLVNPNLGFDKYWNYENKYSQMSETFVTDDVFFNTIISNLENTNHLGNKYFNFSVTYQNHGPYSTVPTNWSYIKNKGYPESSLSMFNRYLSGIYSTNKAIKMLVEYLENYSEPVVLILFGDHNPYLGEANYVYRDLGIDMSINDEESFLNYYSIPYIIYGNVKAKEVFNKSFVGEASTISPNFLMNELFEYLGYEGNEYFKYTSDIKDKIDVIHDIYYKESGKYILKSDIGKEDLIDEFDKVSYYYANQK